MRYNKIVYPHDGDDINCHPEFDITLMPGMVKNHKHALRVNKSPMMDEIRKIMDIISYSDGKIPTTEIADRLSISMPDLNRILNKLEKKSIVKKIL